MSQIYSFDLGIDLIFVKKNNKRTIFKQISFEESDIESPKLVYDFRLKNNSRFQSFVYIIGQAIGSLVQRFEQYKQYGDIFGFLFTTRKC